MIVASHWYCIKPSSFQALDTACYPCSFLCRGSQDLVSPIFFSECHPVHRWSLQEQLKNERDIIPEKSLVGCMTLGVYQGHNERTTCQAFVDCILKKGADLHRLGCIAIRLSPSFPRPSCPLLHRLQGFSSHYSRSNHTPN